jgi:hypothetical protein
VSQVAGFRHLIAVFDKLVDVDAIEVSDRSYHYLSTEEHPAHALHHALLDVLPTLLRGSSDVRHSLTSSYDHGTELNMILVYAGRRYIGDPASLRHRLDWLLTELAPRSVIGSAAAGTDLILLDLALSRNIAAHIVILGGLDCFAARSVADQGPSWLDRYFNVTRHPLTSLEVVTLTPAGHRSVNTAITRAAAQAATPNEPITLVAVMNTRRAGSDYTAELTDQARERHWPVFLLSTP